MGLGSWAALLAARTAFIPTDGQPLDAPASTDAGAHPDAVDQEQRPDQIVGREHIFAHHAPGPFGAAIAARTDGEVESVGRRLGLHRGEAALFERTAEFDRHQEGSVSNTPFLSFFYSFLRFPATNRGARH